MTLAFCKNCGKDLETVRARVLTTPHRHEVLGGQTFAYIKVETVLAFLDDAKLPPPAPRRTEVEK